MAIKIVTDSTSYIPNELKRIYDISEASLSVSFENESFKETEIDNKLFYEKMDKSDKIPTSSQPSIDELHNCFQNNIKNGHDTVGIFLSSEMSGTYSTSSLVKNTLLEEYPHAKIELIDSRTNSMQQGYAVLAAAKAAYEGRSLNEVVEAAKSIIRRSRYLFAPNNLEYLKKGGRIGGAKALIGSILNITPVLTVVEGKTEILCKVRTKKKALQAIVDKFVEDIENYGLGEVIVHHINCEKEAREFAKTIEEIIKRKVDICAIGPVIGVHVGPGTVGIAYYTEKDMR